MSKDLTKKPEQETIELNFLNSFFYEAAKALIVYSAAVLAAVLVVVSL